LLLHLFVHRGLAFETKGVEHLSRSDACEQSRYQANPRDRRLIDGIAVRVEELVSELKAANKKLA
jgi:hypothetical protein